MPRDWTRRLPGSAGWSGPAACARSLPAATRLAAMSTPSTSAPSFAAGSAVVPSPQPRSSTFMPGVMPSVSTNSSPLWRMRLGDAGEVALFPKRLVRIDLLNVQISHCSNPLLSGSAPRPTDVAPGALASADAERSVHSDRTAHVEVVGRRLHHRLVDFLELLGDPSPLMRTS